MYTRFGKSMTESEATELVSSLYESWFAFLVRCATRITASRDMAKDIVQEAFMLLYRELRLGRKVHNPKGWILCVVRRQSKRRAGQARRERELQTPLAGLTDNFVEREMGPGTDSGMDELARLFSVLTPREEEVICLRIAALKYRQIAEQLGISSSAVNTLLARAVEKLQKATGAPAPTRSVSKLHQDAFRRTLQ